MNDGKHDRLGDPQEFELLEQLGGWMREHGTEADPETSFEPFPDERAEALIDRALRVQDQSKQPIAALLEPAANDRAHPLASVAYFLMAAAAIVSTFVLATPRSEPARPEAELAKVVAPAAEPAPAKAHAPSFASVRIDGGGPLPLHQGPDPEPPRICQDRQMQLSLAVTMGESIDPTLPLELTLEANPPLGPSHRFVYDVARDRRWQWADGGQALVFSGTLEQLVALTPGRWTLQLLAGAPGTCSLRQPGSGCSSLPARTIDVVSPGACDAPR